MELSNRLLEVIRDNFKTQMTAANELNVTRQALSAIIKKGKFGLEFLMKLKEKVPKLNINWLINNEGEKYLSEDDMMYNLVKEKMNVYNKSEKEIIDLLKDEVNHLRGQLDFLQSQINLKK